MGHQKVARICAELRSSCARLLLLRHVEHRLAQLRAASGAALASPEGRGAADEPRAAQADARARSSLLLAFAALLTVQLATGALLASALALLDGAAGNWAGALRIVIRSEG